jgi:hypothetical protein
LLEGAEPLVVEVVVIGLRMVDVVLKAAKEVRRGGKSQPRSAKSTRRQKDIDVMKGFAFRCAVANFCRWPGAAYKDVPGIAAVLGVVVMPTAVVANCGFKL